MSHTTTQDTQTVPQWAIDAANEIMDEDCQRSWTTHKGESEFKAAIIASHAPKDGIACEAIDLQSIIGAKNARIAELEAENARRLNLLRGLYTATSQFVVGMDAGGPKLEGLEPMRQAVDAVQIADLG